MEMWNLTTRLLRFMASDLGVEQQTLLAAFRGKRQTFALHRYPPCRHPEKVIGISPHSDGFGLTLLLHVNDTPGLQVSKDGRWHPVRPLTGAFVINVGEILEVLTNGHYKSVFHRVVVNTKRGRATIVVFQDACINGVVKPLPEIGEPPRYRAIGKSEYFKGHTIEVLGQGERFIDTLKKGDQSSDWSLDKSMEGVKVVNRDIITEDAAMAFADHHLQIPDRYVRSGEVPATGVVIVGGDYDSSELPVVDMARLLDPEHREEEIAWLGSACRSWGFFQLINHGVDEAVIQKMKDSTVNFFELPLEDKNAVAVRPGGTDEGFGHHFRSSAGKLDWAENLIVETQPFQQRNLEFWPSNPPTFRDSIDKYAMEMSNLTMRLLRLMASDLGVEHETLLAAFRGKRQITALHHYPPCHHPEKVIGITPHSDGFGLTLLLQVNDTPGLQVSKDGRWHPVRPLPGALIINVGETLEVLTNGHYKSVFHRVVVDTKRSRVTIVVFQDACIDGVVKPLPELGEPRYHAIGKSEYFKDHITEVVGQGERFIDTLKK
uniref:Fe2OG dioxygenase domain-containing protein n=1 Tax=Oryza punctata TaxID=4537 RepID=A0A0E0M089_ORYPU